MLSELSFFALGVTLSNLQHGGHFDNRKIIEPAYVENTYPVIERLFQIHCFFRFYNVLNNLFLLVDVFSR